MGYPNEELVRRFSELVDDDSGRWQITTHSSIYILDLGQRTLLRIPGATGDPGPNAETGAVRPVNVLERDRQLQPIREGGEAGHQMGDPPPRGEDRRRRSVGRRRRCHFTKPYSTECATSPRRRVA